MRRWLQRLAAGLAAGLAGLAAPAWSAELIEQFDAAIEVRADGDLAVTETITVRAEGVQIRRGIYRDFPLYFRDAGGRLREVGFELLEVTRDGRPEPHFTQRNDRGVRIYAGKEDVLLAPGRYTYRLRYVTGRQLRHFPERVELYWNVTGNEWSFPISAASATVRLPGNAAPLRWTGYTGRPGERGDDFRAALRADGALAFATTRALQPAEGLTVVAELPPGAVAAPTQAQQARYALLDNRRYILGGLGLLGVLAFYLTVWRAVGRDPPKGTIIPLFHPPKGVSPALAGYIRKWGWSDDWREFTAAAISLAVKGLLLFDDHEGTLTLSRTARAAPTDAASPDAQPLPAGERALLAWVERSGGSVRIDSASGKELVGAYSSFKAAIENENRHRFFRRNLGYFGAGIVLTGLAIAAAFTLGNVRETELALLFGTAVACVVLGGTLVRTVRLLLTRRRLKTIVSAAIHLTVLVFVGVMAATLFSASSALPPDFRRALFDGVLDNGFPLVLVGGFALLNGLFYYLLRAPTAAGRPIMDQIEGLEMYLRTAESARLNLAGAPEITTEHFERLLPYAIALGAEKPWSQAFEAAFVRAHPGQDLRDAYQPQWRGGASWSGDSFGNSLAGTVASAHDAFASAVPSSSSSGFSGGGGSGGGGGGGGGGGW